MEESEQTFPRLLAYHAQVRPDQFGVEDAAHTWQRAGLNAAECGDATQLVRHDVRIELREHFLSGLRGCAQSNEVAHRSARDIDGVLMAEQLGGRLFECSY